jgi:predicted nucleic acid-binding protein
MARVVVDTNIIFSALVNSQSTFAEILLRSDHEFFVCEMTLVEIFKHKDKIVQVSRLSDDDLARLYHILLRRITLYKEDLISTENRMAAYRLCHAIDESDTPHVALALELDATLWTGDKKLRDGLKLKDFHRFFEPGK